MRTTLWRHAVLWSSIGAAIACGGSGSSAPQKDAGAAADGAATDAGLDDGALGTEASSSADASSPDGGHGPTDASPSDALADAADGSAANATLANARADDAVEAMMLAFWSQGPQYLLATVGATGETGYWTFAQAWDVVLDAVQRHGDARFGGTLKTFYDAQNTIGWSRSYYDDENW